MINIISEKPAYNGDTTPKAVKNWIKRGLLLTRLHPQWEHLYSNPTQENWPNFLNQGCSAQRIADSLDNIYKNRQIHRSKITSRVDFQLKPTQDILKAIFANERHFIDHLSELQGISLRFREKKISLEDFKTFLFKAFRHFVKLQRLTITFQGVDFLDDKVLNMLGRELCRSTANLTTLRFHIQQCPKVTEKGIRKVLSKLNGHLPWLRHLELSFANVLNDKGIIELGNNINRDLTKLISFSLKIKNYGSNKPFAENGFEILAEKISTHLLHLRLLDLSFAGIGTLSEIEVESLLSKICSRITNLESLSLNFSSCAKINDNCLNSVKSWVQRLTHMKKLYLDISRCKLVSIECVTKIQEELSYIPSLQIFIGVQFIL